MKDLTNRQKEVMELVSKGKTNQQVADELAISTQTVKNLLSNVYERLETPNRVSAVLRFMGVI